MKQGASSDAPFLFDRYQKIESIFVVLSDD